MKKICNLKARVVIENPIILDVPEDLSPEEEQEVVKKLQQEAVIEAFFTDYESARMFDPQDVEFEECEDFSYVEYTVVRDSETGVVDLVEGGA